MTACACMWARSRGQQGDVAERRARRAVANSNERRRMRSINAGFQSLRDLVRPRCTHAEKLSKVRASSSSPLSVSLSVSVCLHAPF